MAEALFITFCALTIGLRLAAARHRL